jgi:hypothetical protein
VTSASRDHACTPGPRSRSGQGPGYLSIVDLDAATIDRMSEAIAAAITEPEVSEERDSLNVIGRIGSSQRDVGRPGIPSSVRDSLPGFDKSGLCKTRAFPWRHPTRERSSGDDRGSATGIVAANRAINGMADLKDGTVICSDDRDESRLTWGRPNSRPASRLQG